MPTRPGRGPDVHPTAKCLGLEIIKSIPVVALYAFATKWDAETMRGLGCEDCLTKPITVTSFFEAVDAALR